MESAAEHRSVYESRKRRSWNSFLQFLAMHKPLQSVESCTGADAIDFFKYLDRFGKTKIHAVDCQLFGNPGADLRNCCGCPSRQGWWSLETLVERLRSAYKEFGNGSDGNRHPNPNPNPNPNPFSCGYVVEYVKGVRQEHERSKGVCFEPKRRNKKKKMKKMKKTLQVEEGQSQPQPQPQPSHSNELLDCGATQTRYEDRKQQAWASFVRYLKADKPLLALENCSCLDVIQFLEYLDQFGKTKVHLRGCTYYGVPTSFVLCGCPFKQSWSNLDTLVERLRAAYGEHNGRNMDSNPFASLKVREYLKKVKSEQEIARGFSCKRRKQGLKNQLNANKADNCSSNDVNIQTDPASNKQTKSIVKECAIIDSCASKPGTAGATVFEVLSDEALNFSVNQQKFVALPVNEPIWRGSFITTLEISFLCGLEAHMSNKASLKDIKSASILPEVLHLDFVPRIDMWPHEFDHVSPTDNDVALYFFQEKQRMVEHYDLLVDHITNQDLAMRAVLNDCTVLIFSSLKLQTDHQKIEGKHYMWGLFIGNSSSLPYV